MAKRFIKDFKELKRIFSLLKPRWKQMLLAGFFMGIAALSTAGYAYLVGPVIKSLFMSNSPADVSQLLSPQKGGTFDLNSLTDLLSRSSAWVIGMLVVIAAVVKGLAFFIQRLLVVAAGQQVLKDLRTKLFNGLITFNPVSLKESAGNLVSRFTIDAQIVEHAVTAGAMAFVGSALQVGALATLAISLSPELSIAGFIAFPPIAILISTISRRLRKKQGDFYDAYSSLADILEESRNGLFVVQTFGGDKYVKNKFEAENESLRHKAISALVTGAISSPLNEILGAGALGFTLFYAQGQIMDKHLTPTEFISFFTALFLLYRPVKGFGNAVNAVETGLAALDRLDPIMTPGAGVYRGRNRAGDKAGNKAGKTDFKHGSTGVVVENISAGYGDEPVIKDISFTINEMEKICIVGPSGSGKTTLLNVIGGHVEPESGNIYSSWPVAMVTQDSYLFNDTIFNNVRLGNLDADRGEVEKVCDAARVTEFLNDMGGLDYVAGKNGSNLSQGQRQRVALARALLSRAPIILLDEFTSAIDTKTESLIMENLNSVLKERTVIVVSHKEQTARWADRTIVINSGKIEAIDHFDRLVESSSFLKDLFLK
ncbi:MAG: ABC transporter ATP-binding protein [Deltaproteobacteria bacterium]|nr:ABC transporter ATP-binding protein [Deltaproteobacteria bacterium]